MTLHTETGISEHFIQDSAGTEAKLPMQETEESIPGEFKTYVTVEPLISNVVIVKFV